jgi:AraC-like DNA-binding protein
MGYIFDGVSYSFQHIARSGHAANEGRTLELNTAFMRGDLTVSEVEEGLYLANFQTTLAEDHVFKGTLEQINGERAYLLTYYSFPQFETIRINERPVKTPRDKKPLLIVLSSGMNVEFSYSAGKAAQWVCIAFTHSWLMKQLESGAGKAAAPAVLAALQSMAMRPLSKTELVLSRQLFFNTLLEPVLLEIKANMYTALSLFYRHVLLSQNRDGKEKKEVMVEMEKIIMAHLDSRMPSIENLAARFHMSASTLKRRFREYFGANVYQYYLARKMEMARELIRQSLSVNHVAARMGYESVSHFIHIYKKFHGHSPSQEGKE